ncbi:MAG: UDP-N-acetylglucosamine 1-carboxyvinyltransferase [Deltaproteobacteria bacterium]|nr:UDP-N-acetylglucosamine 1-carboxyvinyltransferase [Deltaproteobacteria bacterium]
MSAERFEIRGGAPITGTIKPSGNKNAALPLLAATLLSEEEVVLKNLPAIRDVAVMLELLSELGVTVSERGAGTVSLRAAGVNGAEPDARIAKQIRASILLAGPLLARRGHVSLPPPGGDVIGRRRIDTHVLALEALGGRFSTAVLSSLPTPAGSGSGAASETYTFTAPNGLHGAEIFLDEASVTGTENAVMAAALAEGRTVIMNAASEPHVQELCRLINAMGGKIRGIGTNALEIEGVKRLHGAEHTLGPDYIEVGSLIALAAVTGGELRITGAPMEEHRATRLAFARLGIQFGASPDGRDIIVPGGQSLRASSDIGNAIPKIEDAPWPGFPADLTSIAVIAATQSEGTVLIHEKMFESRLFFVDRLQAMGARLVLCDPHRVVVSGRSQLVGQELVSPDIRAGMALLIAALCARGKSVIHNVQQIDRGYERIDERLAGLGAQIVRRRD